jgi:hypothetical protein
LLAVAEGLLPDGVRPREANLRRAQSTAYYALFHCLAQLCADGFVGGTGADRSKPAWRQTYRALEHGAAKNACKNREMMRRFPQQIQDFAYAFVDLQERRHDADYDPSVKLTKSEVASSLELAEAAINGLKGVPLRDRRAFAAHVLFKKRF